MTTSEARVLAAARRWNDTPGLRAVQELRDAVDALDAEHACAAPSDDDVGSVCWAVGSAAAEGTGEPVLSLAELSPEDHEEMERLTATLRDAGWVRVPTGTESDPAPGTRSRHRVGGGSHGGAG